MTMTLTTDEAMRVMKALKLASGLAEENGTEKAIAEIKACHALIYNHPFDAMSQKERNESWDKDFAEDCKKHGSN